MTDIYLDNNATTRLDPVVLDVMLNSLRDVGNPSSAHRAGDRARAAIEVARRQLASLLGASAREIVFTAGATESNNLAIQGAARRAAAGRHRIVSATTEHPAVLEVLRALSADGWEVVLSAVGEDGVIDLDSLEAAVDERTALVTVMAANNETGTLAPLADIAQIAHRHGALFHTDATQLMAWGGIDAADLGVDLLSLSSHKMHGPQGVGALYVSRAAAERIAPVQHGGGQERGLRSGTLNTAGIAGLGAAALLAANEGPAASLRVTALRDALEHEISALVGTVLLNGHRSYRLPGTLNVGFPGADADAVIAGAADLAVSTGSACSSGIPGPSHVLSAMGIDQERAASSIRFSLSRFTEAEDIHTAASLIGASVTRVRAMTGAGVS